MGKKKHGKRGGPKARADMPTVLNASDVFFDFGKGKSGERSVETNGQVPNADRVSEAEIYDEEAEYPSSRVIKRAANGDVVVETIPNDNKSSVEPDQQKNANNGALPTKLDSHWESLTAEDKKNILRIDKEEVFEVIKSYQSANSCSCSVCGRRNVAMENELERIYNTLYDNAKQINSDTDFVLFHLNMIKELQKTSFSEPGQHASPPSSKTSPQYLENMRDEAVKYCLSNKAVDSLKEEVLQFKHNKQKQLQKLTSMADDAHTMQAANHHHHSSSPERPEHAEAAPVRPKPPIQSEQQPTQPKSGVQASIQPEVLPRPNLSNLTDLFSEKSAAVEKMPEDAAVNADETSKDTNDEVRSPNLSPGLYVTFGENGMAPGMKGPGLSQYLQSPLTLPWRSLNAEPSDDLKNKYMDFAKTFVSSHPKIANEYVNRMMMYPDIRALTEDLMNNNGQTFTKAMEDFILKRGEHPEGDVGLSSAQMEVPVSDGPPVSREQYMNLQRQIAEKLTGSLDFQNMRESEREKLQDQLLSGDAPSNMLMSQLFKRNAAQQMDLTISDNDQASVEYDEENYDEEYSDYDEDESDYVDEMYDDEDEGEDEEEDEDDDDDDEELSDEHCPHHYHHHYGDEEAEAELENEENNTIVNDEEYDSEVDEQERLEEGRRLIQIAITKLLQKKLVNSYHEKQAENNRLRLLQELEAEEQKKKEKEEKKQRKREKEKEKKRLQQIAKEQEKRKKEEEDERRKKEAEEREMQRREAQRQRVEEAKRKKDEERRRKLEEQRRKEEEQQQQKKLKEEQKKQKERERKEKEELKKQKEYEVKKMKEQKRVEGQARLKAVSKATDSEEVLVQRTDSQSSTRRLSTPPEAVPYGISDSGFMGNNELLNMINEAASKSASTSSSHLQTLFRDQNLAPDAQAVSAGTPLSVEPSGLFSGNGTVFSAGSLDSATNGRSGISNGWNNAPPYFRTSPENLTASVDVCPLMPPGVDEPVFARFSESRGSKGNFNDELNNLTHFLSSATLSTEPLAGQPSNQFLPTNGLWSDKGASNSATGLGMLPNSASALPQRPRHKSIWNSNASENPLPRSSPSNKPNADVWGASSSFPDVISDALTRAYTFLHQQMAIDFVPVDKLYQTTLLYLSPNTDFTYNAFVAKLMTMRATLQCDVLTDSAGLISHSRILQPDSQRPSRGYQPTPSPFSQPIPHSEDVRAIPNALFEELYSPSASDIHTTVNAGSSQFDYNQPFAQPRTSNIWQ
ncbi:LAMI_0F09692g1_1 [Lachancea mirantina]|uniref:Stress response protein NST1 n=1 Tax=Lachancea mirantina TaxID=1230905 RepID=A0A1G4K1C5_9SACH|nr:LAMI_0F09692g1_1 [Lachancea mirantina]